MSEFQYSSALEQLIRYAKSIGDNKSAPFTAERYLIAVIDYIEGKLDIEGYPQSSKFLLYEILGGDVDTEKAGKSLYEYINSKQHFSYLDDLYMKKRLIAADTKAKENGDDEIKPELLLECITDEPSTAVKECLEFKKSEDKKVPESDEKMRSELHDFFSNHTMEEINNACVCVLDEKQTNEEKKDIPENIEKVAAHLYRLVRKYGESNFLEYYNEYFEMEDTAPENKNDGSSKEDENTSLDYPKLRIENLTEIAKLVRSKLSEIVLGQDKAIDVFVSGYFRSELLALTDKSRVKPATFLFAGPPGVGKTFLAESAAKVLDLPFARYDMSEYSDKEASLEFCGSDKVYKNGNEGNFTSFVKKNPKSVILFDEIEKAHISIIHLFLQILDAGRIRDNYSDEEISLKDTIMFFTTNAGKQFYNNAEQSDFSSVSRKVILKALENDINPTTGNPYFPSAICSRFASGNVVMFNNISVHNLHEIAKREVLRHAQNFESEIGIKININERVYSALMYAEGGTADARTIRSRAGTFIDDELFELFRLVEIKNSRAIRMLKQINVDVDLSSSAPDVQALFENTCAPEVLLFSSESTADICMKSGAKCVFRSTDDSHEADGYIKNHEIKAILIDLNCESDSGEIEYLNAEDNDSASRDFLWRCHELYSDIPVYILESSAHLYDMEEIVSFSRQGIRGVLNIDDNNAFADELEKICININRQKSMELLSRSNRLVTYETSQRILSDGKTAEIRLFDFELERAVDSEDSKNIVSSVSKPDVRFEQIIGSEAAKQELKYFVEYLKNPKKYQGTGVRAPKGILLYGPPGTGKTMLAKAMACESDVTFISAEGNQFLKRYVGEGPEKVHELFGIARKYAPSILFIDEIDSIAKERTGKDNVDTEAVLTAFLNEMDGFKNDISKPVFVLAATNYNAEPGSGKCLDPALVRRFDRRLYIDLPDRAGRIRFMKMKLSENPSYAISDEKIENLAMRSTGMSLAEIESIFELSLRSAIRDGNMKVTDDAIDEAFETFNNGEKKSWDESQLERVARHESGHALLCCESGEIPSYLTIAARGSHGGYMQHADNEGKAIYTKDELLAKIRISLGGRAAEIVYYGDREGISTGAGSDLISATRMAENLICTYGMDEIIGLGVVSPDMIQSGPLALEIRKEVNKILHEELCRAVNIISENRATVDKMVDSLIEKTHLSASDIQEIFESKDI